MKKILFLTLSLAFAVSGTFAQSGGLSFSTGQQPTTSDAEARAKESTDKINSILNLTPDVYNQVLQINRNFFRQGPSMGAGRQAAKAANGRDQQLKSVLSFDQWQTLQNAKQQGQVY